jgi:hypothetical protein
MSAVTASTNMDKSKMVFAGVDAGAKIFVELTGDPGVAAAPNAIKQSDNAKIRIALRVAEFCRCRIFQTRRVVSAAVCWAVSNIARVGDWEIPALLRTGRSKTLQSRDASSHADPAKCELASDERARPKGW